MLLSINVILRLLKSVDFAVVVIVNAVGVGPLAVCYWSYHI